MTEGRRSAGTQGGEEDDTGAAAVPVPNADPEAWFDDLYRRCLQPVYIFALRRAAPDEVADVVADVFAVAWRRRRDVPPPPQDVLWLFGVARRVVAGHRRSGRRRQRLLARVDSYLRAVPPLVDPTSELTDRVAELVDRLRPVDREVVRLVAWEQLSHHEVAAVLGCSPNAVAIRWHRSVAALRRALHPIAPDDEDPDGGGQLRTGRAT